MKCYQSCPRFELVSPCTFPTTITITPGGTYVYTELNDQTVLFLIIQFNMNNLFILILYVKQFYLTQRHSWEEKGGFIPQGHLSKSERNSVTGVRTRLLRFCSQAFYLLHPTSFLCLSRNWTFSVYLMVLFPLLTLCQINLRMKPTQ